MHTSLFEINNTLRGSREAPRGPKKQGAQIYTWISMSIHGYPSWISIDILGHPWILTDIHGYP